MAKRTRKSYLPDASLVIELEPSKAQKQQIAITEEAIRSFAKFGIEGTTYTSLAKSAGVSRPLIHHYFPNLRDLLLMAARYARATLLGLAQEGLDKHVGDEKLQLNGYIDGCFRWVEYFPDQAKFWMLYFYQASTNEEMLQENSKLVRAGHQRIQSLLAAGLAKRTFEFENLEETSKAIQLLITGAIVSCVTERDYLTTTNAAKIVKKHANLLLRK